MVNSALYLRNMSSSRPLDHDPFSGGVINQIFTLQFIALVKLQLQSSNETILWLGGHHMRNCMKELQR